MCSGDPKQCEKFNNVRNVEQILKCFASAAAAAAAVSPGLRLWYRCGKCRAVLFDEDALEAHEPGAGQADFSHRKREARGRSAAPVVRCTSHFLQSEAALGFEQVEGKLGCPKCGTRIGSYNWAGTQCSCGAWVTPAIQVVKSKVDEARLPATTE